MLFYCLQADVIDDELRRLSNNPALINSAKMENLLRSTKQLKTATSQYEAYTTSMDRSKEANVRFVNSVAYDFEKCFISDYDLE